MPNPGYPEHVKAQWRVLADKGLSNRQIAKECGVARTTVDRWLPARPTHSEAEIAEWAAALDDGMAYKHVGEVFGVAPETVSKYLPGRAWTPEQIRAHGVLVRKLNQSNLSLVG